MADDETITNSWTIENSRFGLFNSLDHRSGYYTDSFPQPLIVEDTSLEETELELNYQHTAAGDQQRSDILSGEFKRVSASPHLKWKCPTAHVRFG